MQSPFEGKKILFFTGSQDLYGPTCSHKSRSSQSR